MVASAPNSLREVPAWLRKTFCADAADGVAIVYQLILTGGEPGRLWIEVRDGRLEVGDGDVADPNVTFSLSSDDLFAVLAGRENPDLLFMADRIAVTGELSLALKLRALFRTPA